MATQTGASLLAASLERAGAKVLFNLSGNQIMPLYDPLVDAGIRLVHTRHEAAAVHMADAYARLTERPCPVLLTAGPGHANALTALYVARMAESPVVMLSGHAELTNLGRGAFQEMDQVGLARRVAKAAWRVDDPARLGDHLARAYRVADSGRPGPVHLSIPADVLRAPSETLAPARRAFAAASRTPDHGKVTALGRLIGEARCPLLLAGPAMARGRRWAAVRELAERLGVPALPMESPRGANDPALGGVRTIFAKVDLVVLLGRRVDFSLGFGRPPLFAPDVRFARVSSDGDGPKASLPIAFDLAADPLAVVEQMLADATSAPGDGGWRSEVAAALQLGRAGWDALERSSARPMHPLRLMAEARRLLRPGDVFVSDGGEFGQWAQAGIAALEPRPDRVINGPSGAIGGAIPFAIGAALARPEARVLAFAGDGALGYHAMEIDTAASAGVAFTAVIGDDGLWNAEVQIQRQIGGRDLECLRLGPARYDRLAEALGGRGERVEDPAELRAALERAVSSGKPALVDVAIDGVPAPTYQPGH